MSCSPISPRRRRRTPRRSPSRSHSEARDGRRSSERRRQHDQRDQRHAPGGHHAGAAHHLHGDGQAGGGAHQRARRAASQVGHRRRRASHLLGAAHQAGRQCRERAYGRQRRGHQAPGRPGAGAASRSSRGDPGGWRRAAPPRHPRHGPALAGARQQHRLRGGPLGPPGTARSVSLPFQRGRRRRLVIPRGSLTDGEPPFAALEHLDSGGHGARHLAALLAALAAHAVLGATAGLRHGTAAHPAPPPARPTIAATLLRAPPPPSPPAPPPVRPPAAARPPRPSRTPPAPAQAGRVIAQAPAPAGPMDLTGFDLVVGQGESYAGGYSASEGTSRNAVTDPNAKVGGVPDAPASDLSRPASPLRREWSCPWPEEAQNSDIREARVTIRVSVTRDGSASEVEILGAPSGGFTDAARRCAEGEKYRSALDVSGRPIAGATNLINVLFHRG